MNYTSLNINKSLCVGVVNYRKAACAFELEQKFDVLNFLNNSHRYFLNICNDPTTVDEMKGVKSIAGNHVNF